MASQFVGDSSGEESVTHHEKQTCAVCELSPAVGQYRSKPLGAECGLAVRSATRQLKDSDEKNDFNDKFDTDIELLRPALRLLRKEGGKRSVGARNAFKTHMKASDIPI